MEDSLRVDAWVGRGQTLALAQQLYCRARGTGVAVQLPPQHNAPVGRGQTGILGLSRLWRKSRAGLAGQGPAAFQL